MNSKPKYYLLFLFFFLVSPIYSAELNNSLTFGSVAMDIPAVMHKRLTPLTRYLSEKLDMPVNLQLSPNMGVAINQSASGEVDLAYLTPVAYLKAHQKGNIKLVAKTVTNGKASFKLMIVVRESSHYKNIFDLINKSFAFGDKAALLQHATVVSSGLKFEDFSHYQFLGHYDNISRAVLNGDFDAGILKDTMAYQWQGKGLRILYSSPALPPYNIAANGNLSPELFNKIKKAFLELDKKNPQHLMIIKALDKKYDGFAATKDNEYDVVRRLIAPFNNPGTRD